MNLRQIYENAGKLVNLIADNEEMDGAQLQTCAFQTEMLFEMWSLNPRIQFKRQVEQFITNGTDTLVLPNRPVRIHQAQWRYADSTVYYTLDQIDEVNFYSISYRNITAPASKFFWDHQKTLKFFPIPNANGELTLVSEYPLVVDTTDYDTDLDLPPGYNMALVYSLATLLIDQYGMVDATGVAAKAASAVEAIQAQSTRLNTMKADSTRMFGQQGSSYVPLINRRQ